LRRAQTAAFEQKFDYRIHQTGVFSKAGHKSILILALGWRPVLNLSEEDTGVVRAVIEVRITPERGGGFNRLAERISRFDEVESCYLMSGGYDLLVFVSGSSLQKVAAFVSEKLSTVDGVLSTATHFMLRSYKEHGFLLDVKSEENSRLKVTP